MAHAKQPSKQKRRSKALPVLGAAGLSLSLASGASAAIGGPAADITARNPAMSHEITLAEEEISGVSMATFYVFDNEDVKTVRPGGRLAGACGGGCGCAGCGGCGGCWTGTNYTASVTGNDAYPPPHSIRPAHKYRHAHKRTHVSKKP